MLKHNRKGNRWRGYDYSQPGYYFVTICTKFMVEWFGHIPNSMICLNDIGSIVADRLLWLQYHFPYIKIDTWVVMPNHVHAIIKIEHPVIPVVGTTLGLSLQQSWHYQRRYNLLSKTINAFKTTSSKHIHLLGYKTFTWQRSFHDHIIRNEQELFRIRKYIQNNPRNWKK